MSEDEANGEDREIPLWKKVLATLGILAVFAGGFFVLDTNDKNLEQRTAIIKEEKRRRELRYLYLDWIANYDQEGYTLEYLKTHSPTVQELFAKIEKNPEKAQEFIGGPINQFFSKPRKYKDYPAKLVMEHYCVNQSEKETNELFKKLISKPGKLKGLDDMINLIETNPQNFDRFDEDELSTWTLNAAYYLVRHNFKAFTLEAPDIDEMKTERKANPEMTTILTYNLYCALLNKIAEAGINRRHLSERVKIVAGYVLYLKENRTGRGIWLEYTTKDGREEIIETCAREDDILVEQNFNPKKVYLKGKFKDVLYIPLIKTTLKPTREMGYVAEKRIHILPKKIKKEINRAN